MAALEKDATWSLDIYKTWAPDHPCQGRFRPAHVSVKRHPQNDASFTFWAAKATRRQRPPEDRPPPDPVEDQSAEHEEDAGSGGQASSGAEDSGVEPGGHGSNSESIWGNDSSDSDQSSVRS